MRTYTLILGICLWGCGAPLAPFSALSDQSEERSRDVREDKSKTKVTLQPKATGRPKVSSQPRETNTTMRTTNASVSVLSQSRSKSVTTSEMDLSVAPHETRARVAILEFSNRAKIRAQEISYLTDLVRQNAAVLPRGRFTVITRENILAMLPPDVDLDRCIDECEIETGRKIGAHWVITGDVVRFGSSLRVTLKLHHSESGELRSSSIVKGRVVEALERPMRNATLKLLSELEPALNTQISAAQAMVRFKLPEVNLDLIKDAESEISVELTPTPTEAKIKPIQMQTNLQELDIDALQKLDLAVRGERSEDLTTLEKIERWEAVKIAVPEARVRAGERIALWTSYMKKRQQFTRDRFNQLDQRRRQLIVKANGISRQLSRMDHELADREHACGQSFDKLAKIITLEIFSQAQKADYTLDFVRECAPFEAHVALLTRQPYLDHLRRVISEEQARALKVSAEEARAHLIDVRAQLHAAYRHCWTHIVNLQMKIDQERSAQPSHAAPEEEDEVSKLIKAHVDYDEMMRAAHGQPRVIPIGTQVVRGPDWKWGRQDGGVGGVGETISAVQGDLWVRVKWTHGSTNSYRWGHSGRYDLSLVKKPSTELSVDDSEPRVLTFSQREPLLGDWVYQGLEQNAPLTPIK